MNNGTTNQLEYGLIQRQDVAHGQSKDKSWIYLISVFPLFA